MAYYFEPPSVALITPPAVAGDLIVGRSDGNFDRLPIGANGSFLNVSAGAIRWGNTIDTGGLTIPAGNLLLTGTNRLSIGSVPATTGKVNLQNLDSLAWLLSGGGGDVVVRLSGANVLQVDPGGNSSGLSLFPKITTYNNIATAGWGTPAVYGSGRATGQIAANASVATFTPGADGSFLVSGNVLVTASATHSFTLECAYTDEGGTARVVTFNVQQLGGTLVTSITNITGAGPYEGVPLHIRTKGGSAITVRTNAGGTYTSVTYNVEGAITQIA